MKIKDDELKSIMIDLKKVIKGRPLYFGLMAPAAKRGKFRLSKKKGDTKPPTIKSEFNPYEDDKDNKLKGSACQGVITAEKGVLTLHIDGKAPGAAVKFLTHFILREVKYKVVKKVIVAEDAQELPVVPDNDEGTTWQLLLNRLAELMGEVRSLTEDQRAPIVAPALAAKRIIDQQDAAMPEQLQQADDLLDEAFGLLSSVETSSGNVDEPPSIDVSELQQHLDHAKEMAAILPSDRVTNLSGQISEGNTLLTSGDLENAEDVILGLEDEIDGAFQDHFLSKLRPLSKIETELPDNIQQQLQPCRRLIRKRTWVAANETWNQIEKLIKEWHADKTTGTAAPPPPPQSGATESDGPMLAFTSRREKLEPRFLEAQKADREQATRLGAVWGYAGEQAEAEEFDKASGALDRLEKFIDDILKNASVDSPQLGIEQGIVEKRKFLLTRFRDIPLEIEPHLQTIRMKIEDTAVDDDPYELVATIEAGLQKLYDELQDEIDNAINAGDSSIIAGLKSRVRGNPLVKHLLENEFADGSKFQSAILDALDEVEKKLVG